MTLEILNEVEFRFQCLSKIRKIY